MLKRYLIFGEAVQTGEILNVARPDIETGTVPRTADMAITQGSWYRKQHTQSHDYNWGYHAILTTEDN